MTLARPAAALTAVLLAAACALPEPPSPPAATGPTPAPPMRSVAERASDAQLFGPNRGPVRLAEWQRLPALPTPVPAVVYVPGCSTELAARDHVPFLQSLGVAVAVPTLADAGCAQPEAPFGVMHAEIREIASRLGSIPWVDPRRLYLFGHAVGADVVTSLPAEGEFAGVVGLAAACPRGVREEVPTLTFRALDDPVLANRGTRCSAYDSPNSLHLEFAGSDHIMRLQPGSGPSDSRDLVRRAVAVFMGVGGGAAAPTIADADAGDLRQIGALPPPATASAAVSLPPAAPVRDVPAFDPALVPGGSTVVVPAAPPPSAAVPAAAQPAGPRTPQGDAIFLPRITLPQPAF